MDFKIPDYPQPLRAFRVWRLDVRIPAETVLAETDDSGRFLTPSELPALLRSRNGLAIWRPGRNVAECRWFDYGPPSWPEKSPTGEPHEAPFRLCGCGFYGALESPEPKFWSYWDDGGCHLLVHLYVSGLMEAWGRIIEHESGLRAQYARVIALSNPSQTLGLSTAEADPVSTLVRKTAETYEAAYVPDPSLLKIIHRHGLEWFRDHSRWLELEAELRRDGQDEPVSLLPPPEAGSAGLGPNEEEE